MKSIREIYKIGKGPSSSHTMGPERAALQFMKDYPDAARYQVILYGSLNIRIIFYYFCHGEKIRNFYCTFFVKIAALSVVVT